MLPALLAAALVAGILLADPVVPGPDGEDTVLSGLGATTLVTFVVAVWAWAFTSLDDTFVAMAAATTLVLAGVLDTERLFASLGDDTIWLLVASFVVASGVTSSGLASRAACWLVTGARGPRSLVHLLTAALVVTTFAIPATSGRAALALPVFLSVATALDPDGEGRHERLVRALALVVPSVVLVSAIGSLLGAGAHLVTVQVLQTATGTGIDFAQWLLLGLPLAVVNSHLAAELVLRQMVPRSQRRTRIRLTAAQLSRGSDLPLEGPLAVAESRALTTVSIVVFLWCTEALHGVHPAIVALVGALVTTSPRYGSTRLKDALATVPWSLLLFMAAALALGDALLSSGAAQWVVVSLVAAFGVSSPVPFMVAVVVGSALAHLVIQSRSARSAVLVPIVVALAPTMGVSAVAAAFASTAAAGFCHTLTVSAKPVTMFAAITDVPTYDARDLRRHGMLLGPLTMGLVLLSSSFLWPLLGLPL